MRKTDQETGQKQEQRDKERPPLWRSMSAEAFGMFALTFVPAGGDVINIVTQPSTTAATQKNRKPHRESIDFESMNQNIPHRNVLSRA